jgi:hypothetical protein
MKNFSFFLCIILLFVVTLTPISNVFAQLPISRTNLTQPLDEYYELSLPQTQYNYTYEGEDLTLEDKKAQILKKVMDNNPNLEIAKIINKKIIDLKKFENTDVKNIILKENTDFGYIIVIDLNDKIISFHRNFNTWPTVAPYPITDFPVDEDIITITDNFFKNRNINLKNYSNPYILHFIDQKTNISMGSPITMTVFYPFNINGTPVFSPNGKRYGMYAEVDINYMKVSNVWPISISNYEILEETKTETNFEKIVEIAKNQTRPYDQMFNEYYPQDEIINLNLKTPRYAYMENQKEIDGQQQQIFVPALAFPIQDNYTPETKLYKSNIIIPLPKKMPESYNKHN